MTNQINYFNIPKDSKPMVAAQPQVDADLVRKVKRTSEKLTESLYVACNEPTLACYRIQEHIHKTVPLVVDKSWELAEHESTLKGLFYDLEYSTATVKQLATTGESFDRIGRLLKDAIYLKQQIDYNESVKRRVAERKRREASEAVQSSGEPSRPILRTSSSGTATSNASRTFNRFSTSFDFSSRSSVVSSVSADLKDLLSQFTTNRGGLSRTASSQSSKIAPSNSMHSSLASTSVANSIAEESEALVEQETEAQEAESQQLHKSEAPVNAEPPKEESSITS